MVNRRTYIKIIICMKLVRSSSTTMKHAKHVPYMIGAIL